jgi:hypothetical protein
MNNAIEFSRTCQDLILVISPPHVNLHILKFFPDQIPITEKLNCIGHISLMCTNKNNLGIVIVESRV